MKMNINPADFRLAGAVPLDPRPAAAPPSGRHVVEITEQNFAEVVGQSRDGLVVLDFWASWCGPCRQLGPVLERLADEGGGEWVLGKVDCDAQPRLAQSFAVQGIPAVKAVFDGALVAEFTGAQPEAQVRAWLTQLLDAVRGARAGADGPDGEPGVDAAAPEQEDPALRDAHSAWRRGDLAAAAAGFSAALEQRPGDPVASRCLARVRLEQRVQQAPATSSVSADDVATVLHGADVEVAAGRVDEGFHRLVEGIRHSAGPQRETLRRHLVELFEVLEPEDERLVRWRRELANALF